MASLDTRNWLARVAAPALACLVALSAVADEPATKRAADVKQAGETLDALRELHTAVAKESSGSTETGKVVDRPKKSITLPTLTAARLDALMDDFLATSKAPAASLTTDVEFVRRIYLDVTGKLPTPDQARAFVNARDKDKRSRLIDVLLSGPEYATNWARYWRDVIGFHATNQNIGRIGLPDLQDWLAKQIAQNRPWDEVSNDLITATGPSNENGASAFVLAHDGQPVEVAGEVSRIFLGVQIQCAQCHDHPNDSWKRQQFHEFASFFAGTRIRRVGQTQPQIFEVVAPGKPRYTMPDLKNPQTQIAVAPKFFLASAVKPLPNGLSAADRRHAGAAFVTGQDNPWFAKAYVNRVWYALTGDAFTLPVDDMGPQRAAKAPEVLEALASQWQKGGYDVRWLFRTILNSRAYQREVRSTFSASGRAPFAANCPSRLRADQILDSLAQALNLPLDGAGGAGPGMLAKGANKKGLGADVKDTAGKVKGAGGMARRFGPRFGFNLIFGVDPSMPNDDVLGTIPQALFLMNAPQINRAMEGRPGTVLGEVLAATPDNRAALNALYVRVLAREPSPSEVKTCGRYVETVGNRREAFEDILWTLINSTEFITRR